MTINSIIREIFKNTVEFAKKGMSIATTDDEILAFYIAATGVFLEVTNVIKTTSSEEDEELEQINEETAEKIWTVFKGNLKRIGSDLPNKPSFNFMDARSYNGDEEIGFISPTAEMIQ